MVPSPTKLRENYTAFLKPGRILLTGHSHQAWPDCAQDALVEAFQDAALHVDDKWGKASEKAWIVRGAVAQSLGVSPSEIALGQNSHELAIRFLSALDWSRGRRIVTTDGEFHSLRRQLESLKSVGVEIVRVAADPLDSLAERLAEKICGKTTALMVSTVLFQTAAIVPGLSHLVERAHHHEVPVYLDAYHGFKALPMSVASLGPDPVYVSGGGYKYAQWGEGCCWLRIPPGASARPVITGWFAEFAHLDAPVGGGVGFGTDGADVFAGSTYDPVSHYRAARVIEFFADQQLSDAALRACSLSQTQRIMDALMHLDILTPVSEHARGGFVAFRVREASRVVSQLRELGIYTDSRGDILRLGPAPYTTEHEIDVACAAVRKLTQ